MRRDSRSTARDDIEDDQVETVLVVLGILDRLAGLEGQFAGHGDGFESVGPDGIEHGDKLAIER